MNFRLFNYMRGINSLVTCWAYRPYEEAAREAVELARRRSIQCGITQEVALGLGFRECMAGQVGFACCYIAWMAGLLLLAANHAAPEWVMCLMAVVPGATLMSSLWLERRMRARWSI
ncbi:hypothetical protein WJ96_06235 [Burkholderia ubonensis]|uniref:Uncharacterized protein n=1 Tax=Burkholderia ubonensis TaxID=101571 RepID=A0AAW3MU76_9BURK|nr:hypothetical protein [Burkholderia ubonensis]KVP75356.1 hypothetical protein WJ93_08040 [Burkholderia ubonensis]KVP98167.1 hypothetical protein WJ96_06235 [Burkholderia ubonensis]KVZ92865.1 hypothetical protein WL25_17900 [Burkholderia ubonensis]